MVKIKRRGNRNMESHNKIYIKFGGIDVLKMDKQLTENRDRRWKEEEVYGCGC